jgi:cytosine/adenosine deaminase-related metal-dependent hydrolase
MDGAKALGRAKELARSRRAESPTWSATGSTGSRSRRSITPLGQLVYSAGRNEVDLVMVGGQVIEQGKLTRIDENAISTRSMPRTSASNRC